MHRDFDSSAATSERMEQLIRPQQRFKQLRIGTLGEHTEQLATAAVTS